MPFDLSQIKPFLTESTPMICCCNEMISINFWSGWCLAAKNGSHTTISSENVRGRRQVNRPKQRPSRDWRSERCLVGMEGNNSPWAAPSCLTAWSRLQTAQLLLSFSMFLLRIKHAAPDGLRRTWDCTIRILLWLFYIILFHIYIWDLFAFLLKLLLIKFICLVCV